MKAKSILPGAKKVERFQNSGFRYVRKPESGVHTSPFFIISTGCTILTATFDSGRGTGVHQFPDRCGHPGALV